MIMARKFVVEPNVYDIDLNGSQKAYLARDGQMSQVNWLRQSDEDVLTLVDENGQPVAFKPGTTWFEILSKPTPINQPAEGAWRFNFNMPQ